MPTIIHCKSSSSKKKAKLTAKQRELAESWENILKKYAPKRPVSPKKQETSGISSIRVIAHRETPNIQSLNTGYHDCSKKESPVYTGNAIKGIGTMHKSNAIPIFSDEQAIDIATMRRN